MRPDANAPLRWRNHATVQQVSHTDDGSESQVASPIGSLVKDETANDGVRPIAFTLQLDTPKNGAPGQVRTVAQTRVERSVLAPKPTPAGPMPTASDPFRDPFADGGSPAHRPVQTGPRYSQNPIIPNRNAAPADEPALTTPAEEEAAPTQSDPQPMPRRSFLDEDTLLPPVNEADDVPESPPGLPEGLRPSDDSLTTPNDRPKGEICLSVYNDRNCCEDGEACNKSLDNLKKDRLSRYGKEMLDITAPYKPDADTPEEIEAAEQRKIDQFAKAGKRIWKDKNGNVLAEGHLNDLSRARAVVKTSDGRLENLPLSRLGDEDLCFIASWYNLPTECTLGNDPYEGRQWIASTMNWKASGLCHKPLYFEDVQLERYGHSAGPLKQPVVSAAHFVTNIALLPYKMAINPPQECQYALGYYRPGSCAPYMIQPFPLSVRGAAAQAGVVVGANYLLP